MIEKTERVSGIKESGKRRYRRQKGFHEPRRSGKGGDREDRMGFRKLREREKER